MYQTAYLKVQFALGAFCPILFKMANPRDRYFKMIVQR